ncbi:UNVERIFIED_CONTAM: hypothetical protein HDU68_011455 [Siphonaria sp. JEL0065]|nr:hypothetical protein HDU68_011455 [Siphonaria sp. JEL0065]
MGNRVVVLAALLTAVDVAQALTSAGCYSINYRPDIVVETTRLIPEDCANWCGKSAFAMIAPTPSNSFSYYCACANTKPSTVYNSNSCNFGCPGSNSWFPPVCGGYDNWAGYIAWSVYATGVVPAPAPVPVKTTAKTAPPPVVKTTAILPAVPSPSPGGGSGPIPIVPAPIPTETIVDTSDNSGVSKSWLDGVEPSSNNNTNSASSTSGDSKGIALPAGGPIQRPQTNTPNTSTIEPPSQQNLSYIIGGISVGLVVLAVGFAVVSRRRHQSSPAKTTQEDEDFVDFYGKMTPQPVSDSRLSTSTSVIESYVTMTPMPPTSPLPLPPLSRLSTSNSRHPVSLKGSIVFVEGGEMSVVPHEGA